MNACSYSVDAVRHLPCDEAFARVGRVLGEIVGEEDTVGALNRNLGGALGDLQFYY